MQARPGKPIGGIVPVDVGVANGTDEPYLIEPDQIFAINEQGQRIMPVSASDAIQEAGNANALKAGLTGAAKNAVIGGVAGAAAGAAIGAAVGMIVASPAQGALLGAAVGGSVGAAGGGVMGGVQGSAAAHHDAETQISELSLQTREAHPNYSVNGYVFFPKGTYTSIQMTLLNKETHLSEPAPLPGKMERPQRVVAMRFRWSPHLRLFATASRSRPPCSNWKSNPRCKPNRKFDNGQGCADFVRNSGFCC